MLSVNLFRSNLKHYVDRVIDDHEPLEVMRNNGESFVVISAEDYRREQETLYVLGDKVLMVQIWTSLKTYQAGRDGSKTYE